MKNFTSPPRKPTVMTVFGLVMLLFASSGARADESEASSRFASASKLSDEGLSLYKVRDYRHAIEKFLQAFALEPDPNLLYNMARCYEGIGDRDNAIEKYEDFLAKPDADPQGRYRATDALRTLREAREAKQAPAATSAPTPLIAAPAPASDSAETAPRPLPAAAREDDSFLNATTVTLGLGIVSLAAGATSYMLGVSDHHKVTGSAGYGAMGQVDPLTEAQAQAYVDAGKTKKLIGVIAMGVGGALVATSAILLMAGSNAETRAPGQVAIGVAPMGDGGRFVLQGRF
ncbi:MAG TPA: hypothetical protein VHU40_02035 [Polyangia bacterium]|nr:hypothetical protein [Polyangia bacterium]